MARYRGRRRIADAPKPLGPEWRELGYVDETKPPEPAPDVEDYIRAIDDEMDRVLGPSMAAAIRSSPTSAEALESLRPAPQYGLWQITPPDFGDIRITPPPWSIPRPVSWRETITRWADAFNRISRALTPPPLVEPEPGTAEWWEWHYGGVLFDEHLGMLEMPPGKGSARKGTP